jgi:DNA-binding MarR family transcriptional regulator
MTDRRPPSVLLELHSADRLVRELVYAELHRRGLQPNLFAILALIELHEPVTPTELGLESGVRPTTLRDMVNEMVARGHVRRLDNPDDRRSHFLEVTPNGQRFIAAAAAAMEAVEQRLEQELGEPLEGRREAVASLRRASRALLTQEETADPRILT